MKTPAANGRQLIFSSPDVDVVAVDGWRPETFVTFTSLGAPGLQGFGEEMLRAEGIPAIHFISKWNHWHRTPLVREGVGVALDYLGAWRGPIVTYGSSMGGHAAAAYAGAFGAQRAIMLAPQYSIRPEETPHERRWAAQAEKIDFGDDDLLDLAGQAELVVICDMRSADAAHARLFARSERCRIINTPFCGHTPGRTLANGRMIKGAVLTLASGAFDEARFRRDLRAARRGYIEYWEVLAELADRQGGRGRTPRSGRLVWALDAARRGLSLSPRRAPLATRAVYLAIKLKRPAEALAYGRAAVEGAPEHAATWRALSMALQALGETTGALKAARSALARQPANADLGRVLAQALMAAGEIDEALAVARDLVARQPEFGANHGLLGEALAAMGLTHEARAAFTEAVRLAPTAGSFRQRLAALSAAG